MKDVAMMLGKSLSTFPLGLFQTQANIDFTLAKIKKLSQLAIIIINLDNVQKRFSVVKAVADQSQGNMMNQ